MDTLTRSCLPDRAAWAGRRVFVTGHTGFVGGWLALWLRQLGAQVAGYALAPEHERGIFRAARVAGGLAAHHEANILDLPRLQAAIADFDPHVVIHLAGQPLVLPARRDPVEAFAVNTMGTVHLLQACRDRPALEHVVLYTTDKVYRNDNRGQAFAEDAPLGGSEPYGSSKVGAEVAIECFAQSYFAQGPAVSVVRAGNIVGGGDFSAERLVPDVVRAWQDGSDVVIRRPHAVRPWQHVLDAVRGTLAVAQHGKPGPLAKWNLGPTFEPGRLPMPVIEVARKMLAGLGARSRAVEGTSTVYEAGLLSIDASQAARELGWRTAWDGDAMFAHTADWYRAAFEGRDMHDFSLRQIEAHGADAR